jgi:hypothetical protein
MSGAVSPSVCAGTNLEAEFSIRCLLGIRVFQYVTPCRCASSCPSFHNPAAQERGKTGISSAAGESLCHQPLCVTGVWQCSREATGVSCVMAHLHTLYDVLSVSLEVAGYGNDVEWAGRVEAERRKIV